MVHHQPPTPVVTDSTTINGFVNDNIRQRQSRATDMRLYGVCNRLIQGHYLLYWERGKNNLANYFIKNHPTKHHSAIRGTYLVPTSDSSNNACYQVHSDLRGCVKPPPDQEMDDRRTMYPPSTNGRSTDRDRQATRYIRQ